MLDLNDDMATLQTSTPDQITGAKRNRSPLSGSGFHYSLAKYAGAMAHTKAENFRMLLPEANTLKIDPSGGYAWHLFQKYLILMGNDRHGLDHADYVEPKRKREMALNVAKSSEPLLVKSLRLIVLNADTKMMHDYTCNLLIDDTDGEPKPSELHVSLAADIVGDSDPATRMELQNTLNTALDMQAPCFCTAGHLSVLLCVCPQVYQAASLQWWEHIVLPTVQEAWREIHFEQCKKQMDAYMVNMDTVGSVEWTYAHNRRTRSQEKQVTPEKERCACYAQKMLRLRFNPVTNRGCSGLTRTPSPG